MTEYLSGVGTLDGWGELGLGLGASGCLISKGGDLGGLKVSKMPTDATEVAASPVISIHRLVLEEFCGGASRVAVSGEEGEPCRQLYTIVARGSGSEMLLSYSAGC